MVARSRWIPLATLALALPLAACTRKEAANGTDTTAVAAGPAAADAPSASTSSSSQGGLDARVVGAYPLTMDKLNRAIQAGRNIEAVEKANPGLSKRWKHEDEDVADDDLNAKLSGVLARIEREPAVRGAIESAGLSPRDFVLTTFGVVSASAAVQMKKLGAPPEESGFGAHVTDSNIAFVTAHQAEVAALMKEAK